MRIGVDESIFSRFPDYRRGLVVGRDVSNPAADPVLAERLRAAQASLLERTGSDWRGHPRIAAWLETFAALGVGVGSKPPSLAALVKRILKGSELPFINSLVALMNVTSLENLVPCGGDDLHAVGSEILLRPARGDETYRPLGKPDAVEHPDPGELVYADTERGIVLCRIWCWRNSDVTKITTATTAVALNVDLMASVVPAAEGDAITQRLAEDMGRSCGGEVSAHILSAAQPMVDVAI